MVKLPVCINVPHPAVPERFRFFSFCASFCWMRVELRVPVTTAAFVCAEGDDERLTGVSNSWERDQRRGRQTHDAAAAA
jgi:hypothetical protein